MIDKIVYFAIASSSTLSPFIGLKFGHDLPHSQCRQSGLPGPTQQLGGAEVRRHQRWQICAENHRAGCPVRSSRFNVLVTLSLTSISASPDPVLPKIESLSSARPEVVLQKPKAPPTGESPGSSLRSQYHRVTTPYLVQRLNSQRLYPRFKHVLTSSQTGYCGRPGMPRMPSHGMNHSSRPFAWNTSTPLGNICIR